MTTVSARAGSLSSRLSSVVLPAPRNPVSTVSGIGSGLCGAMAASSSAGDDGGLRRAAAFGKNIGEDRGENEGAAEKLHAGKRLVEDERRRKGRDDRLGAED